LCAAVSLTAAPSIVTAGPRGAWAAPPKIRPSQTPALATPALATPALATPPLATPPLATPALW